MEENIEIIKEIMPKLHRKYRNAVEEIIEEVNKKECIMCQQDDIDSNIWMCSKCKDDFYWGDDADSVKNSNLKYCPFCGAKIKEFSFIEMDEEELMEDKLIEIYKHFGYKEQLNHLHEEVYEFTEALLLNDNKYHLEEEIADILVMVNQFVEGEELDKENIDRIKKFKMYRTLDRIKRGYYNKK